MNAVMFLQLGVPMKYYHIRRLRRAVVLLDDPRNRDAFQNFHLRPIFNIWECPVLFECLSAFICRAVKIFSRSI